MSDTFWNEIKKMFKSKQTIAEEEAQKIGDAVKREKEIVGALKVLEDEYNRKHKKAEPDYGADFGGEIKLDRVKYTPESDENIRRRVEAEYAAKKAAGKKSIDKETFEKAAGLYKEQAAAAEEKKASQAEIDALYESMKNAAEADAVKRGIQRSSIVAERLKDYDLQKAAALGDAEKSYKATLDEIDDELTALQNERESALENLDLSYAAAATEKIASLAAERDKLVNETIVKNNEIAKQERDYNQKLGKQREEYVAARKEDAERREREREEYERKYGYEGDKQENYAARYEIALDFYLSLDPDVAEKALAASGNMKRYLGNYYGKLQGVLKDRARHLDKYV